jgi:hypothetical protein
LDFDAAVAKVWAGEDAAGRWRGVVRHREVS